MYTIKKVRDVSRFLIQAYGPPTAKRLLWNRDFLRGRRGRLNDTVDDCLYPFLEKYAHKGSILDLGCGAGSTENELDATSYRDYTGVDISDVAISKAKRRTEEKGRAEKARYVQSDFFGYVPDQQFDVILFRDSIYYVPLPKIKGMLERYSKYLKERGAFVVRLYDRSVKYKTIIDTIKSNFEVVDTNLSSQSKTAVIVFRPREEAAAQQ
ncbi:MAG: class I SAM-dependent methyltransferase [Terriglobia bacterium]